MKEKQDEWYYKSKKVIAMIKNYSGHAKEIQSALPSVPTFMLKPSSSILPTMAGKIQVIEIPHAYEVVHEVELGVVIGKRAKHVSEQDAMSHVKGYTLCLDMTIPKLQNDAIANGTPWTVSKGFDTFCPVHAQLFSPKVIKNPHNLELYLKVNDKERQRGNTKDMLFKIPQLVSYISHIMTLEENDIILTGTLPGVAPVKHGDVITAGITNICEMKFAVQEYKHKL